MEGLFRWMRCCCGEGDAARETNKEEEEMEGLGMEQSVVKKSRSSSSLPAAQLDQDGPGREPHWFRTLQMRRLRVQRGRSNSDPWSRKSCQDPSVWKPQLQFGTATSYVSLEKLGEGSYASVYKGISRINGQLVALKVIETKTEEGVPFTAIREASLLKGLKHANIVLLHDIIHTRDSLTFVFEYVQTDLAQYMNQHPGGLHSHNVRWVGDVKAPQGRTRGEQQNSRHQVQHTCRPTAEQRVPELPARYHLRQGLEEAPRGHVGDVRDGNQNQNHAHKAHHPSPRLHQSLGTSVAHLDHVQARYGEAERD
ncbi:cyclin-dependent kinase 15-like [Dunckerocampus dactyliophorus]|uniref:cyclin-dependent kinase 15-like n=1 Tax=Dunckerocampus dactyliophorus TaxID=161453 RepID=UPI002406FF34|nr:cyclin-dependent kinase 15-like [Dunckerocampus dactyliophorus]